MFENVNELDYNSAAIEGPWKQLVVHRDGHVLWIELDNPGALNAVSPIMQDELHRVWLAYDKDPELRVAVLIGAGDRAFCSGADVSAVADTSRGRTSDYDRETKFTPAHVGVRKPIICVVNGVCAGAGLHFVADCDFAIASETATFLDPHVNVGQVSALEPIGLAQHLPLGAVMRMVLLGKYERLDAQRAYELGMVTEVVSASSLRDRALELARWVAAGSPEAIRLSREAIYGSLESSSLHESLRRGFVLIRAHADHHPDAQEGPRAFFERRDPQWASLAYDDL
ncbi:enoyl-CoA hydratase-related protein [Rhodococcus sp. T2V]|uniref:enoyl-CoA hydratase/isomerase family protein n=1 Tax=Rhodococcus sp. T2V TaxID=3034164 RepID=UPI0023E1D817|nr:enoyl-CoA hydratase-related protein [Rhodococcus sp. T2V]MDF3310053.1 enoyl-CoA hydratase-related protein [Rhodococcus sp. T2V]